jgi:hypothetical protein
MNKVTQKYQVVDNKYNYVIAEKETRAKARDAYHLLGGAAAGYTLKQITTVVVEQKIR